MKALPIQYHMEVFERSFDNHPTISYACASVLPTLSIGDQFDHRMFSSWSDPPSRLEIFRIKDIQHIFWENSKSHIGYKLMVCVEKRLIKE